MNKKAQAKVWYNIGMFIIVLAFLIFGILKIFGYGDSEGVRQKMIINELVSVSEAMDSINYPLEYTYYREEINQYGFLFNNKKISLFKKEKQDDQSFKKGYNLYSEDVFLLNLREDKTIFPTSDNIYFKKVPGNLLIADETGKNSLKSDSFFEIFFPSTHKLANDYCFEYEGDSKKLRDKLYYVNPSYTKEQQLNAMCGKIKNDFSFYIKVKVNKNIQNPKITIDKEYPKETLKLVSCFVNNLGISPNDYFIDVTFGDVDKHEAYYYLGSFQVEFPKNFEDNIKNNILKNTADCFNRR